MGRMLFFFNDPAATEIYTLSLHDTLPIYGSWASTAASSRRSSGPGSTPSPSASTSLASWKARSASACRPRSEEHTSELQSRQYLVCRLLLVKKNGAERGLAVVLEEHDAAG